MFEQFASRGAHQHFMLSDPAQRTFLPALALARRMVGTDACSSSRPKHIDDQISIFDFTGTLAYNISNGRHLERHFGANSGWNAVFLV
jgi:hypothetical protein